MEYVCVCFVLLLRVAEVWLCTLSRVGMLGFYYLLGWVWGTEFMRVVISCLYGLWGHVMIQGDQMRDMPVLWICIFNKGRGRNTRHGEYRDE